MNYSYYESIIGLIEVATSSNKLLSVKKVDKKKEDYKESEYSIKAVKELDEYFLKERKSFDLEYKLNGTIFQNDVWNALAKVPYGSTWSYSDIARIIKRPKALRAVGTAIGNNPLFIILPCHRIIKKNKSLGQFAYGEDIKRELLNLEKIVK